MRAGPVYERDKFHGADQRFDELGAFREALHHAITATADELSRNLANIALTREVISDDSLARHANVDVEKITEFRTAIAGLMQIGASLTVPGADKEALRKVIVEWQASLRRECALYGISLG